MLATRRCMSRPADLLRLPGRLTVPVHVGETLRPRPLTAIPDQAGLTGDELRDAP